MRSRAGRNDGIVSTYRVLSRNYTEAKTTTSKDARNSPPNLKAWWRAPVYPQHVTRASAREADVRFETHADDALRVSAKNPNDRANTSF